MLKGLFYDYEYDGNTYRIRPGGGDEAKNILGLPPVLFGVLSLLIIFGIVVIAYKR